MLTTRCLDLIWLRDFAISDPALCTGLHLRLHLTRDKETRAIWYTTTPKYSGARPSDQIALFAYIYDGSVGCNDAVIVEHVVHGQIL